jgi:hypothetical protein
MRRSMIAAAFAALVTVGFGGAAISLPASPGLLAVKAGETTATPVVWRTRHWRGWRRPGVYGYRRWRRPVVYGYAYRPRVYGFYGPRVYGWRGYRGCGW